MTTTHVGLDDFNEIPDLQLDEPPFRLELRTSPEIAALPDPPDSDLLLGPLILKGCRTIVVGDTGHGKTTLALQMAAAVLTGAEVFNYQGAGTAPILIIDLEQGLRSIKRSIAEANLADQEHAYYVAQPDGLALDRDTEHLDELRRVIDETHPAVVVLDPFYKAHRGDANEERAIVDLMRILDALRAKYGFALILPAHPRKDAVSSNGVRKLGLHDIAGSGAIIRGAEVVIALERLSHGYARLRILKDRDGDLPVGEAWPLIFERGEGFKLDPKEERTIEDLETRILGDQHGWRTVKEWAKDLGARETTVKDILNRLVVTGKVANQIGAPGRSPKGNFYRTDPDHEHMPQTLLSGTSPETWAKSGAVGAVPPTVATSPTAPTSIGDVALGAVDVTAPTTAPDNNGSTPGEPTTNDGDIDFDT